MKSKNKKGITLSIIGEKIGKQNKIEKRRKRSKH